MVNRAILPLGWTADRLLSRSSILRANAIAGYAFGLAIFFIALVIRFWIDEPLPPGFPYLTFFPAVIICAFLAGTRVAVLCAALSFLASWYWFIGDRESFSLTYGTAVALGFFTFIVVVDIALIEYAARSVGRLSAKQAQLNTIIETVPLGLVMAELPSGKIVGANSHVEKMFGHTRPDMLGMSTYDKWPFFHEDGSSVAAHEHPIAEMILRGEEGRSIEVQYQRGDGSKAWVQIMGRPVRNGPGNITGGVVALIDVDEQHRIRNALEEALKAKEVLLYEVNHRVKNSLHLVNSFLFLETLKISNEEARAAIMAAREKVGLIARVHQLLYESDAHSSINIKNAIQEIISDLVKSTGRDHIDLDFEFSGEFMLGIREASPLVLIINEVVTNSLKYGLNSSQPKLKVKFSKDEENMILAIGDNGPGIPVSNSNPKGGLGSQIIEGLVAQIRGQIATQSSELGTTVVLTVPSDPKSADQEGMTQ